MSHKSIQIQEGAVIISDAHYSYLRPELLTLIKNIYLKKIETPQLILMGDIFDVLVGEVPHTQHLSKELIKLLNKIATTIEVLYLEGNHDFNLQSIFPDIKMFPLKEQPLKVLYHGKTLYLAHGDFDVSFFYKIYTLFIRNPFVLSFLTLLDRVFFHVILKKLDRHLAKKDDCKEFVDFENFIHNRFLKHTKCDYFIEGHFHQNRSFQSNNFYYINLAAFACNQRYFIVKSLKDKDFLEEKRLSQGDV